MNDVILKLEQLGFSTYDAKAYLALLRKHPANGYEVSKISGIPVAKVYDTINRLKIKGAIVNGGEDGKYYPVPPEALLGKMKQDLATMIDGLETTLKHVEPLPDIDVTLNFSGLDSLLEKLERIINGAKEELYLSLWPEEATLLGDLITNAERRGVTVICGVFGKADIDVEYLIDLEVCGASSSARLGRRLTVAVGDGREVVISEDDCEGRIEGLWTTTPGITLIAKEYIRHDIWGNILIEAVGEKEFRRICADSPLLTYLIENR